MLCYSLILLLLVNSSYQEDPQDQVIANAVLNLETVLVEKLADQLDHKLAQLHQRFDEVDEALKTIHEAKQEIDFESVGGEAKATSEWDTDWVPINAFTGNKHGWHNAQNSPLTAVPQLLWYEFPVPKNIKRFSFKSRTDLDNPYHSPEVFGPSKYIFWGSNGIDCSDESSWDILYEDLSGTAFDVNNTPKEEDVNNVNFYKCYGFKVLESNGGDFTAISNIRMYLTTLGCPSGMQEIGGPGCCYLFSTKKANWQAAKEACQAIGVPLGLTFNLAEVGTVKGCDPLKLMEAVAAKAEKWWWFGASDSTVKDVWRWEETQHVFPLGYNMWLPHKPENGKRSNCLVAGKNGIRSYFHDSACAATNTYVCQKF